MIAQAINAHHVITRKLLRTWGARLIFGAYATANSPIRTGATGSNVSVFILVVVTVLTDAA